MPLDELRKEQFRQLHILKTFRAQSNDEAVELNRWMTTREGKNGWLIDL